MKLIGTKEEIEALLNGLPRHINDQPCSVDRLKRENLIPVYLGCPIKIEVINESRTLK